MNKVKVRRTASFFLIIMICISFSSCGRSGLDRMSNRLTGEANRSESELNYKVATKTSEESESTAETEEAGIDFSLGDIFFDDGYEVLSYGNYPHIGGIPSCESLMTAFAEEILGLEGGNLDSFVDSANQPYILMEFAEKTKISYTNIYLNGENFPMEHQPYNLLLITDVFEQDYIEINNPDEIIQKPIAADALVFYVSPSNPVDRLTTDQIRDIYAGNILNWSEVGGDRLDIVAFQEDEALHQLETLVMDGIDSIEPPYDIQTMRDGDGGDDDYEIQITAEFRNEPESIGFDFLSELHDRKDIKILEIDEANPKTDVPDSYPLTFFYYAVFYKADENGVPGKFTDWVLSDEGRRIISNCEFALPDNN